MLKEFILVTVNFLKELNTSRYGLD